MKKLKLSEDLTLPLDAVTQKLAWIGTTGSGKTYGASKLAELMWDAGAQFVVLDPVGVWYGLRLAQDGKKPSDITIPIFGGLHGDVPLEPTGGAILADLIADRRISAILDVSQFESDAQKARFSADFVDRFFFRRKAAPTAVHLFLEECQEFIPEHQQRGEERMLHVFTRLQKIGRNYGIGTSLITQRPQEVAKKALNLASTLFVFRTTGSHERAAIKRWIDDKAIADQDIAADLPKLKTGRPHVWSPEWLEISTVVGVLEKRTFNASATPEVGAAAVARELAPIDLERIRADMAATIEKAKAEDPKLLRDRIGKLERELVVAKRAPAVRVEQKVETQVERVIVPMLTEDHLHGLQLAARIIQETFANARGLVEQLTEHRGALTDVLHKIDVAIAQATAPQRILQTPAKPLTRQGVMRAATERTVAATSRGDVTPVMQRILDGLAELEVLGAREPSRALLAFFAGYTHIQSKGFTNAIGALRSAGLVQYTGAGDVLLTADGRALAAVAIVPASPAELQDRICRMLGGASERILRPLLERREGIERAELAQLAGYGHVQSKGFTNAVGRLRTLGFIDYERGVVIAQPVLFLEGAA